MPVFGSVTNPFDAILVLFSPKAVMFSFKLLARNNLLKSLQAGARAALVNRAAFHVIIHEIGLNFAYRSEIFWPEIAVIICSLPAPCTALPSSR